MKANELFSKTVDVTRLVFQNGLTNYRIVKADLHKVVAVNTESGNIWASAVNLPNGESLNRLSKSTLEKVLDSPLDNSSLHEWTVKRYVRTETENM